MYWPFFRSKQQELLALTELGEYLADGLVVPIIKPHVTDKRVEGQLSRVLQTGLRFALVINTDEGEPVPDVAYVLGMEKNLGRAFPGQILPALEVRPEVTVSDVNQFLHNYRERNKVFVHREHALSPGHFPVSGVVHVFDSDKVSNAFVSAFSNSWRIILRDGFNRQSVNGDYPAVSHFDDLAYSYGNYGYHGFGDFATVGDVRYRTGGGQASHVALHLTEPQNHNAFQCRHFVSSVPPATTDVQTKYFDALGKLIGHTGFPGSGTFATYGVSDYYGSFVSGHYPGLGLPKRWSTKHHIQLLHSVLVVSSAIAWI